MTARKPKPIDDDAGIKAFIEALRPIKVSAEGPYKPLDRYRDFVTVFGTDQGKRVLSQIIDHCEGHVPREDAPDAEVRAYIARRRVGLWIGSMCGPPVNYE